MNILINRTLLTTLFFIFSSGSNNTEKSVSEVEKSRLRFSIRNCFDKLQKREKDDLFAKIICYVDKAHQTKFKEYLFSNLPNDAQFDEAIGHLSKAYKEKFGTSQKTPPTSRWKPSIEKDVEKAIEVFPPLQNGVSENKKNALRFTVRNFLNNLDERVRVDLFDKVVGYVAKAYKAKFGSNPPPWNSNIGENDLANALGAFLPDKSAKIHQIQKNFERKTMLLLFSSLPSTDALFDEAIWHLTKIYEKKFVSTNKDVKKAIEVFRPYCDASDNEHNFKVLDPHTVTKHIKESHLLETKNIEPQLDINDKELHVSDPYKVTKHPAKEAHSGIIEVEHKFHDLKSSIATKESHQLEIKNAKPQLDTSDKNPHFSDPLIKKHRPEEAHSDITDIEHKSHNSTTVTRKIKESHQLEIKNLEPQLDTNDKEPHLSDPLATKHPAEEAHSDIIDLEHKFNDLKSSTVNMHAKAPDHLETKNTDLQFDTGNKELQNSLVLNHTLPKSHTVIKHSKEIDQSDTSNVAETKLEIGNEEPMPLPLLVPCTTKHPIAAAKEDKNNLEFHLDTTVKEPNKSQVYVPSSANKYPTGRALSDITNLHKLHTLEPSKRNKHPIRRTESESESDSSIIQKLQRHRSDKEDNFHALEPSKENKLPNEKLLSETSNVEEPHSDTNFKESKSPALVASLEKKNPTVRSLSDRSNLQKRQRYTKYVVDKVHPLEPTIIRTHQSDTSYLKKTQWEESDKKSVSNVLEKPSTVTKHPKQMHQSETNDVREPHLDASDKNVDQREEFYGAESVALLGKQVSAMGEKMKKKPLNGNTGDPGIVNGQVVKGKLKRLTTYQKLALAGAAATLVTVGGVSYYYISDPEMSAKISNSALQAAKYAYERRGTLIPDSVKRKVASTLANAVGDGAFQAAKYAYERRASLIPESLKGKYRRTNDPKSCRSTS